jgi:AcrR family transcriptional regulator
MTRPPVPPAPSPAETVARLPLTRERILRTALALADREGIEAISMRRLGAELGVEAMSIYNHLPNKAAILDGVVETVINDIDLPDDVTDWKACIREVARSYRELALAHPHIVSLIATRPFNTVASLRPVEVGFEIFKEAGFGPEESLHAFRTLAGFITGYTLAETGAFFGEFEGPGQLKIEDVPIEEFPRLLEVAPVMQTIDHDAEFDFAIDVIITGLEAKLDS